MALGAKQKAFVNEYLVDFNATRAAERAGYKGDENTLAVTGHRLLRIDKISELISKRLSDQAMGPDEVLTRLAEQARNEHGQYISANGVVNLRRLIADGKGHLIKGVKETKWGTTVEFYSAQTALELIGKTHKLFTERVEHDVQGRIEITADDMARARDELDEWKKNFEIQKTSGSNAP